MSLIEQIVARAKANKQRIVLPEAEEERTLIAADKVLEQEIADLILIGNPAKVDALAKQHNLKNIHREGSRACKEPSLSRMSYHQDRGR